MAGIMHKIEETLGMGGNKNKEGDKQHVGEHKPERSHVDQKPAEFLGGHKAEPAHGGEQKEGFMSKIKDKVHGGEGGHEKGEKGEKKKKEKKKKHEDGHKHGDSSSSSDSD